MSTTWAILRREFGAYFNSPIAYVFIASFLGSTTFLFFIFPDFLKLGQARLDNLFGWIPWILMFFVPAVTMRLWAEERKSGTLEVLLTLPVRTHQAVLGKFLAGVVFLALALLGTFPLPLLIYARAGEGVAIDGGPIICGYLGTLLMGSAYLAIGCFLSSITRNQIIAFIGSLLVLFGFMIIGVRDVIQVVPAGVGRILQFLCLNEHLLAMSRGVIDSRDVLYYGSVILFFLMLNGLVVESRKWK